MGYGLCAGIVASLVRGRTGRALVVTGDGGIQCLSEHGTTGRTGNSQNYGKIMENLGNSQKIMENQGKSWENHGKIMENPPFFMESTIYLWAICNSKV
jgi:hypothetical protein